MIREKARLVGPEGCLGVFDCLVLCGSGSLRDLRLETRVPGAMARTRSLDYICRIADKYE